MKGVPMRARELAAYLETLRVAGPYPEPTVDTFKAGDPATEVLGVAVGWMSYTWALEEALANGCNLFVTHEPTYFDHYDANPEMFELDGVVAKRRFIEESGLVVLRCHDVWDQYPTEGIGASWGDALKLGEPEEIDQFVRIYRIPPVTAEKLAERIASSLAPMGQPGVQLAGPPDRVVSRLGIGTGAISPFPEMLRRHDVDCAVTTDDGTHYWRDCGLAIDLGVPLIVVHHAVSEEPGVARLASHLRTRFPGLLVHHVSQPCMFRHIGPPGHQVSKEVAEGVT